MTLDGNSKNNRLPAMKVLGFLCLALLLLYGCGRGKGEPPTPSSGHKGLSTLAKFGEVLAKHAENLDESFSIQCTPELHSALMEESSTRPECNLFDEIRAMNGFWSCAWGWDGDTLTAQDISYYAGWRILNIVRKGREDRLNARELATLRAAKALVADAPGPPVEKERHIHDALCGRIEYYANDETGEEKDCAIGALLNGKADCDGYADAMMLCCGLTGIPCRYMNGLAREIKGSAAPPTMKSGEHLWNLVKIAGSWVSVDVTWDDRGDRISYLSYNLGMKDASLAYRWDPRSLLVELAEETDSENQLMPDLRRTVVHSLADAYFSARQATSENAHRFTFVCLGTPLWNTAETEFFRMLKCGGWSSFSYSQSGRMLEVTNITMGDNICFCDTESEALKAIREFAVVGVRSFSLFFSPALAKALFADNLAGLDRLLSRSQLKFPCSWTYSSESGSVSLQNVSFVQQLAVCFSEGEILSLLRREMAERPTVVDFLLPDGFDFPAVQDKVFDCVYSMGVKQFTWSCLGNRISLRSLDYHEEFLIAESEEEVVAYLRAVRKTGKNTFRIYCQTELYAALTADNCRTFWQMLKESGLKGCKVGSDDSICMFLVNR